MQVSEKPEPSTTKAFPSIMAGERPPSHIARVAAVIPAYRAKETLVKVVESALEFVSFLVVVDDACPERSSDVLTQSDRVIVLRHESNKGVGGAVKTAVRKALELGAEYIVKIDADGQMDPSYIPGMIGVLEEHPDVDLVKGNRFADPATVRNMPLVRLIGNSGLTFLVKFASGYWTLVDPTNGFIAFRVVSMRRESVDTLADDYFFEIDLLCTLGAHKRFIAEMEMPAIYRRGNSSLSISRALVQFPGRLFWHFVRRILINYVIVEINVGTLCAVLGIPLLIAGLVFGGHEWAESIRTGIERPTGTIILALLLFILGFQLTLQAILFDVQFATRTLKIRCRPHRDTASGDAIFAPSIH